MLTCPSLQGLDNISQLLVPAYHRVAASVMLTDCIQQVYMPLLAWHSETAVLIVMLKPNLVKKCFATTLTQRPFQFGASQDSILNMQAHEVHSEVKPACMLSEPSSSLHMFR